MSNLKIWKPAAVGRSTGVSLRCRECRVILSNMEALDGVTGYATVFCPRCQKTTMATAFIFCTGAKRNMGSNAEVSSTAGFGVVINETPNMRHQRSLTLMDDTQQVDDDEAEFAADEKARIAALHKSAPEVIWLQVDPEAEQFDGWESQTWCSDQINETDVRYIRADLTPNA